MTLIQLPTKTVATNYHPFTTLSCIRDCCRTLLPLAGGKERNKPTQLAYSFCTRRVLTRPGGFPAAGRRLRSTAARHQRAAAHRQPKLPAGGCTRGRCAPRKERLF